MKEFGAPLFGATLGDFQGDDEFFSFGAPPNRIGIIMGPPGGVDFEEAWNERKTEIVNGVKMYYVSRRHLIRLKDGAGRENDQRDIAALIASDPNKRT